MRKMKARAPPPPGKPAVVSAHSEWKPGRDLALVPQRNLINMKENLWNSLVDITVVLPSGLEKRSVVDGSHAMMDLLVELCLQNHLNPSHHALEIRSSETQQPLSFKPNTLVGTLNVHTVFLKEKVPEEKLNKPGPPKMPEKSVRLVVNYLRTQKAVVRVSPEVPLQNILPVICAKCEVSPENIILLKDNIDGEELELSKSLNELGIKELYAWDNKRETIRKSSLGNDETDKEKKKFLGFFKVNKRSNSKAEHLGLPGVGTDEDVSKSAAERNLNGCLTTPNSPSVNSRSIKLGPSLSLSNVSGISVKSEMKKRRAPLPPSLANTVSPVQDKASEKISLGSQIDLQKKKRRAPAPPPPQPPPPSPLVPSRTEDMEEKRRSTMGVGRQVPQKPPRGSARGPPQLVLPPPPPYPPPDTDEEEPFSYPGEGTAPEASDPRPTLSLPLGPNSNCTADRAPPVVSEAEETVSVGSCFASEDTTEDSGVMSSPSDVMSLDSQHDSMKSKDKWATDQEDCSDQDLTGTPELGPQMSPSWWESKGPGNWHPRAEKAVTASNGDDDLFVAGQFQKTLAGLDDDSEEIGESYATDTSSPTSSMNGVSSCHAKDVITSGSDEDVIPITFIGEVLDDPLDVGLFSNRNNNAGSFDKGSVASRGAHLPSLQQPGKKREELPASPTPSHDIGKEIKLALNSTCKGGNPVETRTQVTSPSMCHPDDLNTKEDSRVPVSACKESTQAKRVNSQPINEKEINDKNDALTSPSWYQGSQHPGGSYGLKYGLTTYKIIPPKPEMKCYDRGVSLSMGAIKIDELGNLVSPHVNGTRTISLSSSVLEADTQPIGKVKEFWRSSSVEKCSGRLTAKRTPTAIPVKPQHQESRLNAEPTFTDPKQPPPLLQPAHQEGENRPEEMKNQFPMAGPCQVKVPAAGTFLKPQRRTSSQYVASAIAKRIGPPKVHSDFMMKTNAKRNQEGTAPQLTRQSLPRKDDLTPDTYTEAQVHRDDVRWPCSSLPSDHRAESAVGARPGVEISSPYGELPTPDCPAGIQKSSQGPLIRSSQRDPVSVGQNSGFGRKQNTSHQKASSASDPKCMSDSVRPSPSHYTDDLTPNGTVVNSSRWPPISSQASHSLKMSITNSRIVLEREEKPSTLSTGVLETDCPLPPSIFGPKKKFRPVIQKPAPKDTSLHAALMEAIHSAGGKEKLRKTAEHISEGGPKKPSYMEAESERSALLAAIRGHSGACSLKKVTSSASEELQSFRDAELSTHALVIPQQEDLLTPHPIVTPPPLPPAPQAPSTSRTASRICTATLSTTGEARQALLDAIRSGTGAARLKKVPLLV
ncbi:protein cordon-bleu isoform X3 [Tamandua tetradactyla]|uniref:protein cordon-bleu isoform X3 n=1 Tax=Tamandua tetradactyla TaxID=48850 RepID=UPI004053BA1E